MGRPSSIDERVRAVILCEENARSQKEICGIYGISERTLRRWLRAYERSGVTGLEPKKPGPKHPSNSIPERLERRVIKLKQRHPSWGARRIRYQYDLPCHWRTVHRIIKRHGMLVRVKAKPQPSKRFQRHHVDSMWQGDTFQFRISGVGKVYVTGFTDDRSRFRVWSGAYLSKRAEDAIDALRHAISSKGRTPREIYLDNGKQFIARTFKREARKRHGIRLIFGRPYHPRGRGKIESYHKTLWRELISQVTFSSMAHFKRELRRFDRRYNEWRKQEPLAWKTPADIYNDRRYFNKRPRSSKKKKTGH
jgi:putative transposase